MLRLALGCKRQREKERAGAGVTLWGGVTLSGGGVSEAMKVPSVRVLTRKRLSFAQVQVNLTRKLTLTRKIFFTQLSLSQRHSQLLFLSHSLTHPQTPLLRAGSSGSISEIQAEFSRTPHMQQLNIQVC